jgi:hypothetical protein
VKKIAIIITLSAAAFCMSGCQGKGTVSFCEGVDQNGKGVNCGQVFSTGDMTAVFKARTAFGTDSVDLRIFNVSDASRKPVYEKSVTVGTDSREGKADLEMYDEGSFRVEVKKHGGDVVSEGTVEIVDTYVKP